MRRLRCACAQAGADDLVAVVRRLETTAVIQGPPKGPQTHHSSPARIISTCGCKECSGFATVSTGGWLRGLAGCSGKRWRGPGYLSWRCVVDYDRLLVGRSISEVLGRGVTVDVRGSCPILISGFEPLAQHQLGAQFGEEHRRYLLVAQFHGKAKSESQLALLLCHSHQRKPKRKRHGELDSLICAILLPGTPSPSKERPASPHHRTASPAAPALARTGRIRKLFSSSSQDSTRVRTPQRKLSVRFQSPAAHQLDGPPRDDDDDGGYAGSSSYEQESPTSRMSQKFAARVASLEQKLGLTGGMQTIVHRANMKVKRSSSDLNMGMSMMGEQCVKDDDLSPTTTASFYSRSTSCNVFEWSPLSQFSTPGTSFQSSTSRHKRQTPEDCQPKSFSTGADDLLPPIEEDMGRYIRIPVQEALLEIEPSIVTVESVAAAKIYLETYFENVIFQLVSPRWMRLKKFEQRVRELDMSNEEQRQARDDWNRMESDNLRQIRVLKVTSAIRHNTNGISVSGFNMIRVLGKGSFGVVRLVTERSISHNGIQRDDNSTQRDSSSTRTTCLTGMDGTARRNLPAGRPIKDVYAMKVIRKSEMLRACQEGHLRAERDFLVSAEGSRWTVPLVASFQDNTNLYLVMEYMIGGDFLGLLLREDVLEEEVAQ
nr:serine/threonine-protein kinase cbk1 [Quercus suber]